MNPLLDRNSLQFGAIPFDKIKVENFIPALKEVIDKANSSIQEMKTSNDEPTFKNTIEFLEKVQSEVDFVSGVFFNLHSVKSSEEMQNIAKEVSALSIGFHNDLSLDQRIFEKVNKVYNNLASSELSGEELKLLEKYYKSFVRNGANLNEEGKEELRKIDRKMGDLSIEFGDHLLDETNSFELVLQKSEDIVGLPDFLLEAASLAAKEKGLEEGNYLFTLDYPSYIPFMTHSERRDLREKLYRVFMSRCFKDGKNDNKSIVKDLAILRHKRANLLGYGTHAEFVLEERMAKKPESVSELIKTLFESAKPVGKLEMEELRDFSKKLNGPEELEAWDYAYYQEKLRKEKFDIDDEILKPYFPLEKVIDGVFEVVKKLYGLTYTPLSSLPTYHPDVKVYEVKRESGEFLGLFYADFFPRQGKRGGAWMTNFKGQYKENSVDHRPHVAIVCNFTKPTETKPSLLTFGEVLTFFHEFGHSLHGILADGKYESLSGTNVYWDFVELPSQIFENWAFEKECLDIFASHFETGEKIPFEVIQKIKESSNFHEGRNTLRQVSFAMLDMAWHNQDPESIKDVGAFEKEVLKDTLLLPHVEGTNISCAFSHIFNGGYSAGYYSYKWAEILDADAFELFKEKGIFNREIAKSFQENILSMGGAEHPMVLYKKFRGKEPTADALLKRGGLRGVSSSY